MILCLDINILFVECMRIFHKKKEQDSASFHISVTLRNNLEMMNGVCKLIAFY